MAAIRVDVLSLAALSDGFGPFDVHLNCWRATLLVNPENLPDWFLDGVSLLSLFGNVLAPPGGNFFTLGGLVLGSRVVNLNRWLRFSPSPMGTGRAVHGCVILEYLDEQLPDPQR